MAKVYNWEEKRGGLMCGYNHCLQVNDREFCLITQALMRYAETEIEYEKIYTAVTLIKDMEENSTKVDSNPIVIREDDPDDTDYCNNDCEHCEWVSCPKETFRKVFEVDDDVPVIIRVEGSDES